MFSISTNLEGNLSTHVYFSKISITDEALAELKARREAGEKVTVPTQYSTLKADIPVNAEEIFSKLGEDVIRRLAMAQLKIKMRAPGVELVEEGKDLGEIATAISTADYSSEGRARMSEAEKSVRKIFAAKFGEDVARYEETCVRASKAGWDKVLEKLTEVNF